MGCGPTWTRHAPPRRQRRSASRTLPKQVRPPPAAPRQASPAWAIALLGGALAGSGPGTSPCIDGLSLVSGMVIPQSLVGSNHAHGDGLEQEAGKTSASLDRPTLACKASSGRVLTCGDRMVQMMAAVELSVVGRSGPVVTAVNGTLVARPSCPSRSLTSRG